MTDMTTEVEALAELLAKATPGPWDTLYRGNYWNGPESDVLGADSEDVVGAEFTTPGRDADTTRGQMYEADARAIVACVNFCRDHLPALVADARRWRHMRTAYQALIGGFGFYRPEDADAIIDAEIAATQENRNGR
jgi:hypothetical protein